MPHWNSKGEEEWICQKGEHICTGPSAWIIGTGNVCPRCLSLFSATKIADEAWERYNTLLSRLKFEPGDHAGSKAQKLYDKYQKELDDAWVITTLEGYKFRKEK